MKRAWIYILVGILTTGLLTECKTQKKTAENTENKEVSVDATTGETENNETVRHPRPGRVPAYRGVIARVQPDGDTLHIFLRGDEWSHFSMTTDGYEVRENANGKICYMKRTQDKASENGQGKEETNRQAHDASKRTNKEKQWLEKHGVQRMVTE